jgi:exopolysaccharide biosynthesis polyprenyl glycosylphosphotransferase
MTYSKTDAAAEAAPASGSTTRIVPSGLRLRSTTLILPSILLLVDLLVLECAFLLVYWTRFLSGWFASPKGIPDLGVYLVGSLGALLLFVGILSAAGMYDLRRRPGFADDITGVARAVLTATILLAAAAFFYRGFSFSRTFVVGFGLASYVFLLCGRLFSRYLHLIARSMGVGLERVAVVGRGRMQDSVLRTLQRRPGLGMVVVGELLRPGDSEGALRALGSFESIHALVEQHDVDLVLVTLPFQEVQQLLPILESLADSQVRVVLVPDLEDVRASSLHLDHVENLPFMELRQVALSGIHRVFKRAFDIVVSSAMLVLLLPLLVCVAVAVRATSPGPALFRQQRVGRDGRIFDMLKYRTMRQDAEQGTGPIFAKAGDPRRTRIGRWLRSSSLDELPQLYNVLRGDMSLVGPRPERPVFVQEFRSTIPRYFERHKVRSGITGWAQVNGLRGDTPLEARTRFDIHYVENWSLAFDIKILVMTLRSVLSRHNAY